ncbi:AraC family transcriptional regulator [Halalkalibacter urbisdiaboli]|uniref:AraC family transcriptional regulator n=1 Tax=Halalkalibacter urbisdiaboli TaxID=1960589 RepID=UPI0013FD9CD0|nr:AraC family transcriptional regulator [Halalkalibacter urbisdiaboli]
MSCETEVKYETIAFRTQDKTVEQVVNIYVVGMDKVTSRSYSWDGVTRKEKDIYIFQYTLSGEGALTIDGETYYVKKGQAFMVKVPSEHIYYLPEQSVEWEFIFLTLQGEAAATCWENMTRQYGNLFQIPIESDLMKHVFEIYKQAYEHNLHDPYYSSSQAYMFLMLCYRHFKQYKPNDHLPDSIMRATHFIQLHYQNYVTVDDIAVASGLSKYYLIKRFRETMNMTPNQYLTKVRLEHAVHLLKQTNFTIKEIAIKVGYSNDNYFNKVFKKVVGISPGEFRQNKQSIPFNRLVIQ